MPPAIDRVTASTRNCVEDVARLGSDGLAKADLARSLADGDEHDVHDADAADDQRDGSDCREHEGHDVRGGLLGGEDLLHVADGEVVIFAGSR